MKFIAGVFAGYIWCVAMLWLMAKTGFQISNDTQVISTAIIIAGAMAGEK